MLMRLVSRYWLLVPLLLLAVVIRDWVEKAPEEVIEIEETIDMRATQSDYYLEQFNTRKFDSQGNIEYQVTGQSLAHYPIDDRSEINKPSVVLHRESVQWKIDSALGELQKDPAIFTLHGDVVVKRESDNGDPVTMRTDQISILTDDNEVRTDKPIEIVAKTWQLRSIGLQSSLNEGKLNLLSGVTGRYEVGKQE